MKQHRCLWLLPAFLLLAPGLLSAQPSPYTTLTGTVVSDSTGTPLEGVHVFIAVSMTGTVTDREGRYRLEGVPLGAHRLYVSILGYEPQARDVMLREAGLQVFDFRLQPAVLVVGDVTVEGRRDRQWQRRLEKFIRLFIGETPNAQQTKILNPEVLDFDETLGHFTARASETLVIENEALGYRIQYFLKEFEATPTRTRYDGEPLYEDLAPEHPEQAVIWEANRRRAFLGSFRHFALALLAGRLEEQGFLIYGRPAERSPTSTYAAPGNPRFPIQPDEVFSDGATPVEKTLDFQGFVEIVFQGEAEDPSYLTWQGRGRQGGKPKFQTSWLQLEKGPTLLDYKGDILDPYGVTFSGYLAFERVGDELPKEYRPR